jgi:hypothetical protein
MQAGRSEYFDRRRVVSKKAKQGPAVNAFNYGARSARDCWWLIAKPDIDECRTLTSLQGCGACRSVGVGSGRTDRARE